MGVNGLGKKGKFYLTFRLKLGGRMVAWEKSTTVLLNSPQPNEFPNIKSINGRGDVGTITTVGIEKKHAISA